MTSLQTVRKCTINGDNLGTVADLQGSDATSELLLQVIDRMAYDSSESGVFCSEATALV